MCVVTLVQLARTAATPTTGRAERGATEGNKSELGATFSVALLSCEASKRGAPHALFVACSRAMTEHALCMRYFFVSFLPVKRKKGVGFVRPSPSLDCHEIVVERSISHALIFK